MKRKVIKLGPATLVVSLPSKWTKQFNINSGDDIEVEESEGKLLITTQKRKETLREISIEINKENKHNLKHILTHIYRRGYNKINIKGDNIAKEVKKYTSELLLGFEVTSRNTNSITIENVAEPRDQKYETIIRRIFLVIKETQETVKEHFKNNKFNLEEIEDLRNQTDRFIFFCRRIIAEQSESQSMLRWELLTFLMHIQHGYYYMYKYAIEKGIKKDTKLIDLLTELESYFDLLYQSYFKRDQELIHKIQKLKDKYQFGECLKLIESNKNQVIYSYIREIFRLTQLGTSPILSLLLSY